MYERPGVYASVCVLVFLGHVCACVSVRVCGYVCVFVKRCVSLYVCVWVRVCACVTVRFIKTSF